MTNQHSIHNDPSHMHATRLFFLSNTTYHWCVVPHLQEEQLIDADLPCQTSILWNLFLNLLYAAVDQASMHVSHIMERVQLPVDCMSIKNRSSQQVIMDQPTCNGSNNDSCLVVRPRPWHGSHQTWTPLPVFVVFIEEQQWGIWHRREHSFAENRQLHKTGGFRFYYLMSVNLPPQLYNSIPSMLPRFL